MDTVFFGNTLKAYGISAGIFIAAILVLQFVKLAILSRLKTLSETTPPKMDPTAIRLIDQTIIPLLYVGAFYFAAKQLVLNPAVDKLVTAIGVVALTIQMVRLGLALLIRLMEKTWFKKEARPGSISGGILTVIKTIVWGLGTILILDNLGFNVSAIVAGLGITGIAVALAAQTILGDLFNYFVIFFDRPFEEGDFIVFEDYMGEIENIGIKSTRIRSLNGEQIVISNSGLTSSKIRNYKRMAQRRITFQIGVTYETPDEKLKRIPEMIRKTIEEQQKTRVDRVHFAKFGDFSLNFEVVYYVLNSDYNLYMDIQQKINFTLKEMFEKERIDFAYPTSVQYQFQKEVK